MEPNFDVRYGDSSKKVDWRCYEEPDKDDDEPLKKTPTSVVEMLGFDPLEVEERRFELRDSDDNELLETLSPGVGLEDAQARAADAADRLGVPVRLVEI